MVRNFGQVENFGGLSRSNCNSVEDLHHHNFSIYSLVRHATLMTMKWQVFLTCLISYWQKWNLICSAGEPNHIPLHWMQISEMVTLVNNWRAQFISNVSLKYVKNMFSISKILSRLLFVSLNSSALHKYKEKTGSWKIF